MRAVDALKHAALLVVPLLLVLLAELLVRLSGAAETCPNRHTGTGLWKCDPILHFGVDPAFGSPELAKLGVEINSQGFRGAEFGDKQPGAYRILALGDSCTFGHLQNPHAGFVAQPYPKRLQNLVDRRDGHGVVEVLNAGQPGYNSWHGVMLLRGKLRDLEPDLVTVRFGWNDHLLSALGESQRFREPATALGRSVEDLLLRTALYAFARRLGLELRALLQPVSEPAATPVADRGFEPTIPLADYENNLRRIVELARRRGAEVWLLTAPSNPDPNPSERVRLSRANALPFVGLLELHDRYNAAVRRVGAELAALVVDMDRQYRVYSGSRGFAPTDAIHPTQAGHNLEAETLYRVLQGRGVVSGAKPRGEHAQ